MERENIKKLRNELYKELAAYKKSGGKDHIKLNIPTDLLEKLIFDETYCYDGKYRGIAAGFKDFKLLDMTGVSWYRGDMSYMDFSGTKGVKINPQEVADKKFYHTVLKDVKIDGSFYDCYIEGADFRGTVNTSAIPINPQKVQGASLKFTHLEGVEITGSLDGIHVTGTDFTGVIGDVFLNPQTVYGKNISDTKLAGVTIIGDFTDCEFEGTDFTGSKGAVIYLENKEELDAYVDAGTNFTDATVVLEYETALQNIRDSFKQKSKLKNSKN